MERHFFGRKIPCIFLILVSLATLTSSSNPWPYLQVYPPVNDSDGRTPLHFALMLSFGGDFMSIGALPGVQIALDYINSQPSILPGYSLHYTLTDSQCNRTVAIDSFFREMIPSPAKVGWVGSGCSVATEPTAELSQFYNITQLSCASVSPELFHENKFRHYFQLLSTSSILSCGFYGIIRTFNWRKVALITQNEILFVKMMDDLKKLLSNAGIQFTENVFTNTDTASSLATEHFDSDARIFVWAMYSSHARVIACEAHKRGLRYPKYQFLIFGWYREGWLLEPATVGELNCTLEERTRTLNYALTVEMLDVNTNASLITEGGLTLTDFEEQYIEKVNSPVNDEIALGRLLNSSGSCIFPYSQHCHEATITLAYALHQTSEDLKVNKTLNMEAAQQADLPDGETFSLANFSYSNSVIVERMFHHFNNTDFLGITGNRVRFNKNGSRPIDSMIIHQYHPGDKVGSHEVVEVGLVSAETKNFSHGVVSESQMWPEGIPSDGIPDTVIVTVATPLTVIYCILSALGCCFAVFCLIFNITCRKKKLLTMSSTCLDYLIGVGSLLFYLSIATAVLPSTDQSGSFALCKLVSVTAGIAFSLSNGTIVMKMVRVWYINNRPKLNKKFAIRDVHLFVAVMVLVALDVAVIGFYLLLSGLRGELKAVLISNREKPSDTIGATEKVIQNLFYVCPVSGPSILFTLLLGFKVFLMVMALILALRTSKVKAVGGLQDSKYIAAAVYIGNIIAVVSIVSHFSLVAYVNVRPAVYGLTELIGVTTILCLTFVPKIVALYRDPDGENITPAAVRVGSTHRYTITSQGERKLETLRQRVRELQASLKQFGHEEDDQDDEEGAQPIVVASSVPHVHFSDDTGLDIQPSPHTE